MATASFSNSLKIFGDIYQSTKFKFTYKNRMDCQIYPSFLTMWHYFIMIRYNGETKKFLDDIFNVLNISFNIGKDIYKIIIDFCEISLENINPKTNILKTLYATNEAHTTREYAYCIVSDRYNKWYSARSDSNSIENYSPMILFEFSIPILISEYSLKSANDCPYRDPYHWYLFGCFGDKIIM